MADKGQHKSWNRNKSLAIAVIILFLIVSVYVGSILNEWNKTNDKLQQPRTFHITFFYFFNGQGSTPQGYIPDIKVDLSVSYERGTLIVDDPVTISGIAVVNSSIPQQIRSITFHFQNAQNFPVKQNNENITEGADILLYPTQNSSIFVGTAIMSWALEGNYNPYFGVTYTFSNQTGTYITPLAISSDVAITVYPKTQYAQTVTSNVSMILAVAVYVLTIIGTGSLVLTLWDRTISSNQTNKEPETGKTNTDTKDNSASKIEIKEPTNNNSKSTNKDRK